jgi:gliding motility-associated-like protein
MISPSFMRALFIFFGIFFPFTSWGQNLVPNSSFENYTKYPCSIRIGFPGPPDNIGNYLTDWYSPTNTGTPDIYTSEPNIRCSNSTYLYNLPNAPTGIFYIGIFFAYTYFKKSDREYIQTELTQSLKISKVYKVEIQIKAEAKSIIYSNNIGFLFTTTPIIITSSDPKVAPPILMKPQVNNDSIITSFIEWKKISGFFVADQPYKYLTIGNFFDDTHTKFKSNYVGSDKLEGAYYYFDDISVTDADVNYLVAVPNLGRDTTLCVGQTTTLHVQDLPPTTYRWDDGSTALTRTVAKAGTYFVTATTGQYSVTDSIRVTIEPPVRLPADTVLCRGETLTLAPDYPAKRAFQWSDGSRDSTLTVSQAGTYSVRVPSAFCTLSDTITVRYDDCPGVVPNVFTPNGDGKNDAFVIPNITSRPWLLEVYNRWGKRVYRALPYANDWRAEDVPSGLYYYGLFNEDLKRTIKGWVTVIKDK